MKARDVSVRDEVILVLEELVPDVASVTFSDSQHLGEPPVNLDSLGILELLLNVTTRLGIQIGDDEDIENFTTLRRLVSRLTELYEQSESR